MPFTTGMALPEPWSFRTTNVRELINEALEVALQAVPGNVGVTEPELLIAINNLHHAADELERSRLEMKYGAKR